MATLTLNPLPLRSSRFDLSLFPQYGPQQAWIACAPPAAGAAVGIDVRAAGAGADAGFETLAFRHDRTERTWRYSSASPFAPGFEWRLSGEAGDAPWRLHPDPSIPLTVDPMTEG